MPNTVKHIGAVSRKTKILRALWNVVYLLLFRLFPTKAFWWWRWLLLKMFGAKIDKKSYVYSSVRIWAPWNLRMERGTCLGPYVICYNQDVVWLQENAIVSQDAYLCTAGHETDKANTAYAGLITAGITIEKDAWVGARAFIGIGVVIGEGTIVGANAGVYKDMEPMTIVGGNPAKVMRKREL